MSENEKKLEEALLDFIETNTKEPLSEDALKIIPEMAQVLLALWNITG